MKLQLSQTGDQNLFSGHGPGYVAVNNVRYQRSLVVTPDAVRDWEVSGFEGLTAADFEPVVTQQPEIVILGTGAVQRFPHPGLLRALWAQGIGFEVMDSPAACRTYNILAAEGRRVVAAILID